jgi:hypothetical protein
MFKRGFILVTVLLMISIMSVLAFSELTYLQVINGQVKAYYTMVKKYNAQKSELAYQQWLAKK